MIQPVIFAAGRQRRWGDASSKHMVQIPVHGSCSEPLLYRTLRQLEHMEGSGNGFPLRVPMIVAKDSDQFPGIKEAFDVAFYPELVGPHLGASMIETCKYFAGTSFELAFLLGDVYWTDEALRVVLNPCVAPTFFNDGWDVFGVHLDSNDTRQLYPAFRQRGKLKSLLACLANTDSGTFVSFPITDRTQDFDIQHEHTQFLHGLSKNKHFQKTPEQVALRRKLGIHV